MKNLYRTHFKKGTGTQAFFLNKPAKKGAILDFDYSNFTFPVKVKRCFESDTEVWLVEVKPLQKCGGFTLEPDAMLKVVEA